MKKFLTIILGLISIISINIFILINSTFKLISKENINDILKEVNIVDVVDEETFQTVNNTLEEVGVPQDYISEFVENDELKDIVSEYVSESVNFIILEEQMPNIDQEELSQILKDNAQLIITEVKNKENIEITNSDIEYVYNKIDEYVPQITSKIEESKEEINDLINNNVEQNQDIKQVKNILNIVKILYKIRYVFLAITVICLIIISIFNIKKLSFLKNLGIINIIYSASFFVMSGLISFIIGLIKEDNMSMNIISISISKVINTYKTSGIICLIIGIVLIITKLIITQIVKVEKR